MVKCAHKTVFCRFLRKCCFLRKFVSHENIYHLICDKKGYIYFWRKMNSSSKKWSCSSNLFFAISSKNISFYKKIVWWKNIQNLVSHKKRLYSFSSPDASFPSKRTWLQKRFFAVFSENAVFFFFFLKKTAVQ